MIRMNTMKTKSLILMIVVILVFAFFGVPTIYRLVEEFKGSPEGFVGPGGCKSEAECEAYCEQNPEICKEYRTEEEFVITSGEECEKWWYECKDFCAKTENFGTCWTFCKENPKVCELAREENITAEFVPKPDLTIGYYKGLIVNLFIIKAYTSELDSIINKAKDLNANVIDVWIETDPQYLEGVNEDYLEKERLKRAKLVELAHKNGLQVNLRLACWAGGRSLSELLPCVREEAEIAQELDVYQITVFGEIDAAVGREKIDEYAPEILKEVRKYYTGRVGIGFCCSNEDYADHDITGYDFLLGTVYSDKRTFTDFLEKDFDPDLEKTMLTAASVLRGIANTNNISLIIVGETGCCDSSKKDPEGRSECEYFNTLPCNAEEEAVYYENILSKTNELFDGYFLPYESPIMSIKNEPAETVVKEWYTEFQSQ